MQKIQAVSSKYFNLKKIRKSIICKKEAIKLIFGVKITEKCRELHLFNSEKGDYSLFPNEAGCRSLQLS